MKRTLLALAASVLLGAASTPALAQDDAVASAPGPALPGLEAATGTTLTYIPPKRKRLIKVLQKKDFLKIERFEFTPYLGMVTNDPFIRRLIFGGDLGYHITEIFAVELRGAYSPDLGDGDLKPITKQIIDANQVTPEVSRLTWFSTANFTFSPIYGKVTVPGGDHPIIFDIYGTAGVGAAGTVDDLELIQKETDDLALRTENQVHGTVSFGGGLRVVFAEKVGIRFETRTISYIGVLESTRLELKNNVLLSLGATFFFGRRID